MEWRVFGGWQVSALVIGLTIPPAAFGQTAPVLVRSQSGPSGTLSGDTFRLDEVRNRFVYPADNTLTVYFEWEAPAGAHVLTATWKRPDGSVASVSPDVRIESVSTTLASYWIFSIAPPMANGTWNVDIRVDGQPAGSHAFEVAGLPANEARFTLDQVFRTHGPALVHVHKRDTAGRRVDSTTGFVAGPNTIVTAFQSIDSAAALEIEFADGRRVVTSDVAGASRLGDWAVVRADTREIAPIPSGDSTRLPVGERLAAFIVEGDQRMIAAVTLGAVSSVPGHGSRLRLAPALTSPSVGGPLIDTSGRVVGIVGGSLTPGSRVDVVSGRVSPGLTESGAGTISGTGISELPPASSTSSTTLAQMMTDGVLTSSLRAMPEFLYGNVSAQLPKSNIESGLETREFSAADPQIAVYGFWAKKEKLSKGEVSALIYDVDNKVRMKIAPRKVTLKNEQSRIAFTFAPKTLPPGRYRIDTLWDNQVAWRTYVRIVE